MEAEITTRKALIIQIDNTKRLAASRQTQNPIPGRSLLSLLI
jgi:hypothetical protein